MGEQGRLPESPRPRPSHDFSRNARERLEQRLVAGKRQGDQCWTGLDDLEAEPTRNVIGETRRAELRDREASAGKDDRRRFGRILAETDAERPVAMLDGRRLAKGGFHGPGRALFK